MNDPYFSVLVTVRPQLVNTYINGLPITESQERIQIQTKRRDVELMIEQLETARHEIERAIAAIKRQSGLYD